MGGIDIRISLQGGVAHAPGGTQMGTQLPLYSPVAAGSIWRNKQENVMAEPLSGAPILKKNGQKNKSLLRILAWLLFI